MKRRYDNYEEILLAVHDYIVRMNKEGGKLSFPIDLVEEGREPNAFRLSNSGSCVRKMAYTKLYPEVREEMSPRTYSIFMLGDVLHEQERALLNEVTELRSVEADVNFYVDDEVGHIKGHTDGVLELSDGPSVLDIKTAGDSAFQRMAKQGVPPEYTAQLNAYMDGLGIKRAVLWVYNKNTSDRMVLPVSYDQNVVNTVRERFRLAFHATKENLPPCEYQPQAEYRQKKPTGREYLPWQCVYCPFAEMCWGPQGFKKVTENGKTRFIRDNNADVAELEALLAL